MILETKYAHMCIVLHERVIFYQMNLKNLSSQQVNICL